MKRLKSILFFFAILASLCVSFPSEAYWFSGGYRPILSADSSTFFIGQSLGRAAGTGYGYGGGFGYGFGIGFGFGMLHRPWHRFGGYPRPSYAQYKRLQVQAENLLALKMRDYYEPQNQETTAREIRKEEKEFRNFEQTTSPEIRRLDQNSPEKKPRKSLISNDGLVTVKYY